MKYTLFFCMSLFAFSAFSQTNLNTNFLINKWIEAKFDSLGNVVQADINLGGWANLTINNNKTVVYAGPFDCGFGHSRNGTWVLNAKRKTLTFIFTEKVGFMNAPGTVPIHEKDVYRIERLNSKELVLISKTNNTRLVFMKSETTTQ